MLRILPLLILLAACYPSSILDGDDGTQDDDDLTWDDDDSLDDDDATADDDDATQDDDDTTADDDDATQDDDDAIDDDDATTQDDDDATPAADNDGDGWTVVDDCDDNDPLVHPGSTAQLDGRDADCDGRNDWLVDIWISVDDAFEFCIDHEDVVLGSGGNWSTGFTFQHWLPSGQHTLGITGWDTGQVITAAIAHFSISDGTTWVSDATWRYDPNPTAAPDDRNGWCGPLFDDSGWDLVNVIGPIGTSPWGNAPGVFPPGSPAMWIWDHFPVDLNTQYLRKGFVLP